ncbi:Abi-alpha family protein [Gluconobacter sphaericus]|uniref:DUF4393 domain-containing protein n=1 Tax=Gluconobacter sphaericus NBRC 12467 TaxID=1307951 RepID=A0AA37SKS2_9PROT|nr:Abi-alpha family protein [Gluconobacter sphaericus]MBF0886746.1 DUF4393 domain-containing protein [Gluconobacter sphaericus]GBR56771.1 hypothetical protein AA12467_2775 [Gluconobacter sphaericus NBRC 12467]GEB43542.1 hypothetical protein GSP01_23240 [Gluconobacter sphaericus NBRC 12467]GLQ85770.1 hypothetical protein GCM10007872_26800 [Gluconobacter sphaericus NBRC 12467]
MTEVTIVQEIIDGAHAVKAVTQAVPGMKAAISEVWQYWVTDKFRYARAKANLEHMCEMADKMTEGKERVEDVSCKQAEKVIEACIGEDREELQKLWAAMLARIMTGNERDIRSDIVDVVKKFEPNDALVLKYIFSVYLEKSKFELSSSHIKTYFSVEDREKMDDDDVSLSFENLFSCGCIKHNNSAYLSTGIFIEGAVYRLTARGIKIMEAVNPNM